MSRRPKRPARSADARPWRLAPVLIAAAVLLCYANAWRGPFIFDDGASILENRSILSLDRGVWSPPFETPVAGRPLVNLTFALNYAAGGFDVTGYHAVNIALHLACALLLYGVTRRALASDGAGLAAAVLWAVHPLATEAVTYITQRSDQLMAACLLGALYASIRAHAEARPGRWLAGAVAVTALGMGAKESMAVAPVLIAAYDRVFHFPTWRDAFRARGRLYLALAATWLILPLELMGGARGLTAGFTALNASPWTYLLEQTRMITRYLRLSVLPVGLVINYGWPQVVTLADVWPYAAGVTALGAATVAGVSRASKAGYAGLWVFVTLAPTSSFIPITTEVGAERRMYVPLMAIVTLLVALGRWAWRRWASASAEGRAPVIAVSAVALILGLGTGARNGEYQSSLALAETTWQRYPTPAAASMYGTELAAAGRLMEAERFLRLAAPSFPPGHYYLATVLSTRGKTDEAVREFDAYIANELPQLDQVRTARLLAADLLVKAARFDEASRHYEALLAVYADDAEARLRLADVRVRQERFADAIPLYERAVAATLANATVLNGLGVALIGAGRIQAAVTVFERAVAADPAHEGARANLARAQAMLVPR